MGAAASISAGDIPDQVTCDVMERMVGAMVWQSDGRSYFDKTRGHEDSITRQQFLEFVDHMHQKAATAGDGGGESGPSLLKAEQRSRHKKGGKKRHKVKKAAAATETDIMKQLERKKRRELMRIQKAKAANELFAAREDEAAARRVQAQYEADTKALEMSMAVQKATMKRKLADRKAKAQQKRLERMQAKTGAKLEELEKTAADELAATLAQIQSSYAAAKANAVQQQSNVMAVREQYEKDMQAARLDAIRKKSEQVLKLQSRLANRRLETARKAIKALDDEFNKVRHDSQLTTH
jgi:hypothetical protein